MDDRNLSRRYSYSSPADNRRTNKRDRESKMEEGLFLRSNKTEEGQESSNNL